MEANQQNNVNRPIIPPLKKPILPDQVVKNNASESIKKNFNNNWSQSALLPPPPPPPPPISPKGQNNSAVLDIKPKRPPPPRPIQVEDENLIYGNVLDIQPDRAERPPLPKNPPPVRSSQVQHYLAFQETVEFDKRLSSDKLSLNDVKRILYGKFNDYEFENEKLEKILIKLPKTEYLYFNDWLNAFSIKEIRVNFYTNTDDLYIITIEELKNRIGKQLKPLILT